MQFPIQENKEIRGTCTVSSWLALPTRNENGRMYVTVHIFERAPKVQSNAGPLHALTVLTVLTSLPYWRNVQYGTVLPHWVHTSKNTAEQIFLGGHDLGI